MNHNTAATMKKKITISVYWPDDWKSVVLDEEEYQEILSGEPFDKEGEGYYYEGEDFEDWWSFEGDGNGNINVVVSYGDGGVGFDGTLDDCEIDIEEE